MSAAPVRPPASQLQSKLNASGTVSGREAEISRIQAQNCRYQKDGGDKGGVSGSDVFVA
jgi:hypothetical protein